jgi:putative oxidoreductase
MFPQLSRFTDLGLLLLRLMVSLVFVTSGYSHLKHPARAKSIEMSKGFTIFLGIAEVAGGLGVAFAVLSQLAAFGLILIMFGAIQKKMFTWQTGFWGRENPRLALRPYIYPDEPGPRLHKRRRLRADEIGLSPSPSRLAIGIRKLISFQHLGPSMHRLIARLLLSVTLMGNLAPLALAATAAQPHACCVRKAVHHCHDSSTPETNQLLVHSAGCCNQHCGTAVTTVRWAYAQPRVSTFSAQNVETHPGQPDLVSPNTEASRFQSTRAPPAPPRRLT